MLGTYSRCASASESWRTHGSGEDLQHGGSMGDSKRGRSSHCSEGGGNSFGEKPEIEDTFPVGFHRNLFRHHK
jgi:hypothetical protein